MNSYVFPLPAGSTSSSALISVEDWRGAGGDSTDTGTLLNAIAAAKAAGGMQLHLPARFYTIEQTLLIDESHIRLVGEGAGHVRTTAAAIQASPRTKIIWNGAAGGTIVKFASSTTAERRMGGGLRGIQLDGNGFRAARGLHLDSWYNGTFDDVCVHACSESQVRLSVLTPLSAFNADVQYNIFTHCMVLTTAGTSGIYHDNLAYGWHLTGDTVVNTANSSINTFIDCHAYMSKGTAWKLENCDDNFFYHTVGSAAYASSTDPGWYGIELGSSDQDSINGTGNCRFNFFHGIVGRVKARASQTGGASSGDNMIYGFSRTGGCPLPTIEAGGGGAIDASLYYQDSNGFGRVRYLGLEDGMFVPGALPDTASLFIGTTGGPLCKIDKAGVVVNMLDTSQSGNFTPVFSFATPGDSVITHTTQVGRYLKLGHIVYVVLDIAFNTNAYTTAAGDAHIDGLPFAALTGDGGLAISFINKVTFNAATNQMHLLVPNTASRIELRLSVSAANGTIAGIANFPASTTGIRIAGSGIYWTS